MVKAALIILAALWVVGFLAAWAICAAAGRADQEMERIWQKEQRKRSRKQK